MYLLANKHKPTMNILWMTYLNVCIVGYSSSAVTNMREKYELKQIDNDSRRNTHSRVLAEKKKDKWIKMAFQ
jgi:hypothetical protein